MTILYCAIAVTLRRQHKTLRSEEVPHMNYRRKRQAIRMCLCVMVAFYLLVFPVTILVTANLFGKRLQQTPAH